MNVSHKLRSFITESTTYSLFNLANKVVPFLLLPVLIRLINVEEYGYFSIFTTLESLLIPIVGLNMYSALAVDFYKADFNPGEYLFTIFCSVLLLVLVFTLLLVLSPARLVAMTGLERSILISAVICSGFSSLFTTVSSLFRLRKKAWLYGKYNLFQSIVMLALLIAVASYFPDAEALIAGRVVIAAVFVVVSILILRNLGSLSFSFRRETAWQILRFSLPTVVYSISAFIFISSDRFLIKYLLGVDQVGYYTAVYQLASVISIIGVSISAAWMPWLFENLKEENPDTNIFIVRLSFKLILILIAIGLLACLVFPFLARVILPGSYHGYISVGYPLIFGFVFEGIYLIVSPYVFYAGKTRYNAFIGIVIAVVNVALNLLLIPLIGVYGAAYTFLLSWVLLATAFFFFSNKVYPMPWRRAIPASLA